MSSSLASRPDVEPRRRRLVPWDSIITARDATPREVAAAAPRMEHVFERTARRTPQAVAVECGSTSMTYRELDRRADELAGVLAGRGVGAGARVALLLERSLATYVALLGVLKAGATFVPIDPESPTDRVGYVLDDAEIELTLTSTTMRDAVADSGRPWLALDESLAGRDTVASGPPRRESGGDDPAAYVIYTSGSSGRPKGVEVAHSSIVNFLDVVPEVYDVRPTDRVYQGMTISFDFSIEEIWPTWAVGATLVAGPNDERRLGADLADFLEQTRVSVLYCVPTLLATIPRDLPGLRAVMVGGEACPAELVERWSTPGRRMLNTYGPTEATVTATWCELHPGRPVTIGRPLPTYTAELTDPEDPAHPTTAEGAVGEITLGGPGVARGYVGRPDLTAERFLDRGGRRLYRTGDLGRVTTDGEIEYLGRADAEVKVRGHRVDLGEIESVLLTDLEVGAAVVTLDPSGELAAYVVAPDGRRVDDPAALAARLHADATARLPAYMVPATLDVLEALPTMASGKVDRPRLPAPTGRRLAGTGGPVVAAADDREERVAAVWAEVFGLEPSELSVTADFFDDLAGHSLLVARVVTRMREREVGSSVTVRDLYAHPTVRALTDRLRTRAEQDGPGDDATATPPRLRHSRRRIARAGAVQATGIYLFLLVLTFPVALVYTANNGAISLGVLAQFLVAGTASYLVVRWILPVLLGRLLSAGIRPGRHPLWGRTALQLWALNLLLGVSPLPVLNGSLFMAPYLRLLGARVGRRTQIATSDITLPRLLEVADDAAVGYGAHLHPWRVEHGWVVVERVRIGTDAVVGANAALEPGSEVGDGAVLGEQSVLDGTRAVPDGQTWVGSPPTPDERVAPTLDALRAGPPPRGWRWRHVLVGVAGVLGLEGAAIAMILPSVAVVWAALLAFGLLAGVVATVLAGPVFVVTVCAVVALGRRVVLPRTPVGVHPLRSVLGQRKWVADALLEFSLTFTNSLYATLYTVGWMRLLGARVGKGAEVSTAGHLDPDLLTLGHGSFVADMASVGNATFAHGRMALERTEVGERAFVGNAALVSAGVRTGDGSLLGVHTLPPVDGVPEGTSWLGSPAIHLPRRQDSGDYDETETFRPGRSRVAHRLGIEFVRISLPASLLGLSLFAFLLVLSSLANGRDLLLPALVAPLIAVAATGGVLGFVVAVKRHVVGTYRPRVEPLWNTFVRQSEFVTGLYEAAVVPGLLMLLIGTPFLPMALRLFGARIGRGVWMGTTFLTEFDLVEIGDDATIGSGVSLQTHLFEDRVMKMDRVRIEAGATVGSRAIVLYDAVVGPDADLGALSLVMKGEELAGGTRWRGIPAERVR